MNSMLADALERSDDEDIFEKLIEEQTPGGLNEMIVVQLKEKGVYSEFEKVMNMLPH